MQQIEKATIDPAEQTDTLQLSYTAHPLQRYWQKAAQHTNTAAPKAVVFHMTIPLSLWLSVWWCYDGTV